MSQPTQILDGTPPFGTKGTITLAGTVYIIEKEKLTTNWSTGSDRTATGFPSRERHTRQKYELELTLQLASSATPYPPAGTAFTYAVKNEAAPVPFYVLNTPEDRNNEDTFIETCVITCRQGLGAITVS